MSIPFASRHKTGRRLCTQCGPLLIMSWNFGCHCAPDVLWPTANNWKVNCCGGVGVVGTGMSERHVGGGGGVVGVFGSPTP